MRTALLTGNGGRARLWRIEHRGAHDPRARVTEVECMIHPAQQMLDADLYSTTKPGGRVRMDHSGHRKGVQTVDDRREGHAAESERRFAELVVRRLESQPLDGVRRLVIAAEPRFLGWLRKALRSAHLSVEIVELPKDLTTTEGPDLVSQLERANIPVLARPRFPALR